MSAQNNELKTALEDNAIQQGLQSQQDLQQVKEVNDNASLFNQYIWPTLLPLLVSLVVIGAYHYCFANKKAGVAVVDVSEVVAIQQSQFVKLLSGANVTDKDREQSFLMVSSFGERMKTAISEIQKDCHCTLVVKAAIIGEVADYTDSLKAKMGITGRSVEAAKPTDNAANVNGTVAQEDFLKGLREFGK